MTQPSENVAYIPMSLELHSPRQVAGLIQESAPELFTLMFGSQAIPCLTELVQRSHNRFSHRYIKVAEINQQIVGIATYVPAEHVNDKADYIDILNFIQRFWLNLIERFILQHILQHTYPDGSFYIGNLAVATDYRNRGIGRQLLSQCIAEAALTSSTIFISVDVNNGKARKLYELLGFQTIGAKTIRLFGTTIGSYILSMPEHSP